VGAIDEEQFRESHVRRAHERCRDRDDPGVATQRFVHGHNVVLVLGCKLGKQECRRVVGHTGAMLGDRVVDITLDYILSLAQQKVVDLSAFGTHTQHRLNLSGYEGQQHGLNQYLFNTQYLHYLPTTGCVTPRSSGYIRNTSPLTE
jgi:hypothetical protein